VVEVERKRFTYKEYEFMYKVEKSEEIKNHYYITVVGGPDKIKAYTSCGEKDIKPELMKLIKSIGPKKLKKRTPEQERKINRKPR
jgi:hypothetical protein